ncbi:MAG: hypothetical protein WC809_15370 [Sinimarinibacterium sp.]
MTKQTATQAATRRGNGRQAHYADRVLGGLRLIAVHEVGAIQAHVAAVGERVRVAHRARGVGELLRNQFDLLPESRNRWRRDQLVRRELWRGFVRDLKTRA